MVYLLKMVIFHSFLYVYQRVYSKDMPIISQFSNPIRSRDLGSPKNIHHHSSEVAVRSWSTLPRSWFHSFSRLSQYIPLQIYIYIYIFGDIIYIWRFPKMRVPPNHPMQSDCPEHILNPETIQLGTPIYGSSASAPFTLMWSCASTSWLREQCRRANAAACIFLLRMAVGIDPIIHPKIDIIQLHPKSVRIVVGYWWYTMVYLPPWKMMEFVRLDHHPND